MKREWIRSREAIGRTRTITIHKLSTILRLKRFGDKVKYAATNELTHLHGMNNYVVAVVCSWSPGRKACPNYEAVKFQPWTLAKPALDSRCPTRIL